MEVVSLSVPVVEPSQVAAARRAAVRCAEQLQFDETDTGKVALVATEAATNVLKHGGGGEIVVRTVTADAQEQMAVELLALDHGPGMNAARCLADGYSTVGTHGIGLGAVSRASALFDVYSTPQRGTALVSRVIAGRAPAPAGDGRFDVSGVSVARLGETACGDGWRFKPLRTGGLLIVTDGLGHGPQAAEASRIALELIDAQPPMKLADRVARLHEALRPTRGAALAIAEIDLDAQVLRYCGLGNIVGMLAGDTVPRHLVSHNGTAGHEMRRVQEFTYPWSADAILLMHSDGLATHWRLEEYPGLLLRSPALIAGVLYRDFKRGRDDATIAVVRQRSAPARAPGTM
jgi:anti-sigma regulatory factor (Ser/Thr protein kinase)